MTSDSFALHGHFQPILNRNPHRTMTEFGRYRLSFEPGNPDPHPECFGYRVDMETSGEADLQQLLNLFTYFLRANGYVFNGTVGIVE